MAPEIKSVSLKVIEDLKHQGKFFGGIATVDIFKKKESWFLKRVKELCAVTSLHGYSHTIQTDYPMWERILWGIASVLALIGSIVLLWISWTWNAETPTVTVIESNHYATWNIPFPAITICSLNKISAKAALNLTRSMNLPNGTTPEEMSEKLRMLLHFRGYGSATDAEYNQIYELLYNNDLSVRQVLDRVSPTCGDMLKRCMWKGTQWRCDSLFQTVNTSEGLCCSFNYFGQPIQNYASKVTNNVLKQPRRVTACGFQTGLSVILDTMTDDYHSTVLSTHGFKIMIHNAYDYPDENAETKVIMSKLEAFVSVMPESTYSTDDVYPMAQEVRDCYADYERRMDTLTQYSYINCLAECRSSIAYKKCGCIPFDLPNNNSKPTCNMNQIRCIQDNMVIFESSMPGLNSTITVYEKKLAMSCNCLPDCSTFNYPSELTTGTLDREHAFNALSFFKDVKLSDDSLLHVFFNDLVSTHYRKDIYQNWLGVLASFGGLLGLFLGFSIVTAFELVYFFTIRVLFDRLAVKKRKVHVMKEFKN